MPWLEHANPLALGRYALTWVALAALAVLLVSLVLTAAPARTGADPVAVAAERGGCVVRSDTGGATAGALDVMQPPTFGPRAAPAAPGVYRRAPRTEAVVGSLRHGVVVLQYRSGTARRDVLTLQRLAALAPSASIVTPDRTGMRYAVAATAWGRLLGCPHASSRAFDAVRAFALRYRGRGPDAQR